MKLSRIYSNKRNFKNIDFNLTGINVILGQITKPSSKVDDSHNLGKTTLLDLIDFLLLKKVGKNHFLYDTITFSGYDFYLEILLNSGTYITIKRSVDNWNNVYFVKHPDGKKDWTMLTDDEWDFKSETLEKAQNKLAEYLSFDISNKYPYRRFLPYVMRKQSDFADVFRTGSYSQGKDLDWKPVLLDLLGFKGEILVDKYQLENKLAKRRNLMVEISQKKDVDKENEDKLRGAIAIANEEKLEIEKYIDSVNFYTEDRKTTQALVEKIESQIEAINARVYAIELEQDQLEKAINREIKFDLGDTEKLYNEISIYFSDQLKKDYSALITFQKEVTEDRKEILSKRLNKISEEHKSLIGSLISLNKERSEMLSYISDEPTFMKFKGRQQELVKKEIEIERLNNKLSNLTIVKDLDEEIEDLQSECNKKKKLLEEEVTSQPEIYSNTRSQFNRIMKEITSQIALLSIKLNAKGNPDFNADIQNLEQTENTLQGKGNSYKKILCAAFDISVLITHRVNSYYRFLYQDGVLEALDNRKKVILIDLIRRLSRENDFQYIFTVIDSDLPRTDLTGKIFQFEENDIVLTLKDEPKDATLFGIEF